MKIKMYVVHDSKAAAYLQPWFNSTHALAKRNFADCVNDKTHNFGRHPEDYRLFYIAEFNDHDAKLEPCAPHSLGNGIEFIELELGEQTGNLGEYRPELQPTDVPLNAANDLDPTPTNSGDEA